MWSPGEASSGSTPSVEAGTTLLITHLGGVASIPNSQLLCVQAPQNLTFDLNGLGSAGILGNPVACGGAITQNCGAGIYVIWTTFISAIDTTSNAQQFVIVPQFKIIGGGSHTDADNDGLESCTSAGPGRPCETTADDAGTSLGCASGSIVSASTTKDRDCDGLLDGIEVAWGSDPLIANTDTVTNAPGDSRRDIEEMIGPGALLTNPRSKDSDFDSLLDGGLSLVSGSGNYGAGNVFTARVPTDSVTDGTAYFAGDNCPNTTNPAQANLASVRLGYAAGDPGTGWTGQVALPAVRPDRTNPAAVTMGDSCHGDLDRDFITDSAEPYVRTGGPAGDDCNPSSGGLAAPTGTAANTALVHFGGTIRDTDGDRVLDGRECQRGTGPRNNGTLADPKNICVSTCPPSGVIGSGLPYNPGAIPPVGDWAGFMRVINIATTAPGFACGTGRICDLKNFANTINPCTTVCGPDSDGDLISDAVETYVWGTSPANVDSDRDGCSDTVEIVSTDGNVAVGSLDLLQLSAAYQARGPSKQYPPSPTWDPIYDFDGSGDIASADLLLLSAAYQIACTAAPGQLAP